MTVRDLSGSVGAMINLHGRHWVALKRFEENFVYLDSMEAYPRDLTAGQLEEILLSHPTYAMSLI